MSGSADQASVRGSRCASRASVIEIAGLTPTVSVTAAPAWDSPETEELFASACGDCHSNLTKWPWYTNVAPVSWLTQRDVEEGRSTLNLSELGTTEVEVGEIAEIIREGEMPPWQYTLVHGGARLSDQEKEALISGLQASLSGTVSSESAADEGAEETGAEDDD